MLLWYDFFLTTPGSEGQNAFRKDMFHLLCVLTPFSPKPAVNGPEGSRFVRKGCSFLIQPTDILMCAASGIGNVWGLTNVYWLVS